MFDVSLFSVATVAEEEHLWPSADAFGKDSITLMHITVQVCCVSVQWWLFFLSINDTLTFFSGYSIMIGH